MFGLIALTVAGIAGAGSYMKTRGFVRRRLRFVDAVQRAPAPLVAGVAATMIAAPVVAILPIIGAGTALALGAGVGLGTAAGVKDIRAGEVGQ